MKIIKTVSEMSKFAGLQKKRGRSIGFVPTMGYLHKGHLSLVKKAKQDTDVVVVSIFVNPAQFGPNEDFEKYPRDFERDEKLLEKEGIDAVFYPPAKDMYPEGYRTYINVEGISEKLCGRSRPGHFRGVATVVAKLFNIVKPDIAYFGHKDAQQAVIIKRMVKDFNMDIDLKVMPTVREKDGLAMSSRNVYLSERERKDANILSESLNLAKKLFENGIRDAERIKAEMRRLIIMKKSARIDYISITDSDGLSDIKNIDRAALVALAVWIGKTRLIDNIMIGGKI